MNGDPERVLGMKSHTVRACFRRLHFPAGNSGEAVLQLPAALSVAFASFPRGGSSEDGAIYVVIEDPYLVTKKSLSSISGFSLLFDTWRISEGAMAHT